MGTREQELLAQLNLEPLWMPFTANRQFKAQPRLLVAAKDMHYTSHDGRQILDGIAGLWAVNAGHCRAPIVDAIKKQAESVDYVTGFQLHHPSAFLAAERLTRIAPAGMDHVFFVNSGSEAVDTALKMALAYHRVRGQGTRTRFIGRERGYHGIGFGGISVGGIVANRKQFGNMLVGVDHLQSTYNRAEQAFTKGEPEWGGHLADELTRLVNLHDASTIAAVIVEPVAGSTGILPPPKGYLKKLREITAQHGILLIFDEVITGFGRLGHCFASERYGVEPDMITFAKGVTNAAVPMAGVMASKKIYDAFMTGPEHMVELFHGYTYSGHPLACAAAIATLDTYEEEGLLTRACELAPYWEERVHALRGLPHVIDIRNIGLIGAVEFEPDPAQPAKRAFDRFVKCFENNLLVRQTGDIIALSPPLIIEKREIDQLFDILSGVLKTAAD
jgi:beta-alanine--pyruvate transaminase